MKLVKLTLSLIATALVAFSVVACGDKSASAASSADSTTTDLTPDSYNGRIAFIRMDSLMNGYGLYIDQADEFAKKQQKAQAELASKGRALEREAMEYQEKAQKGLVTRYQAQTTEESLQKKQQAIMAYRDRVLGELAEEEAVISSNISKAVLDYLKEYNHDKKYSMILQTTGGNPVILADPALDITADVLAELNKRYEVSIASKPSTAESKK